MSSRRKRPSSSSMSSSNKKKAKTSTVAALSLNNGSKNVEFSHWLMKSEPESRIERGIDVKFGIDDLIKEPESTTSWDGVRNYQARNYLRDQMKVGHQAFFYHSNCKEPSIVGIVDIVRSGHPDEAQFDSTDLHFDPKATVANPIWYAVDIKYNRRLKRPVTLKELKDLHKQHNADGGPLANIALCARSRLSVQPVTQIEWDFILHISEQL